MICGHYRLTPDQAGDLTPAEIHVMLDGIDWLQDREWERAVFQRMDHRAANNLYQRVYPHFRTPRVLSVRTERREPRRVD